MGISWNPEYHSRLVKCARQVKSMVHVTYKVVRHEDGCAYTVNGVFSESFPTHEEAREAARRAAAEQRFREGGMAVAVNRNEPKRACCEATPVSARLR